MITLYVKSNCRFSAKAIASLKEHNVPYTEKNISDPKVLAELIELGGKRQVPFLDDDSRTPYLIDDDVDMYESNAIVRYVEEKYSKGGGEKKAGITLYVSDDADICEACE